MKFVIIYPFFGVNFILQKFCLCKKNDKYEVWVDGAQRWRQLFVALQENVIVCRQKERRGGRCSKVETTLSKACCSHMPPDGKGEVGGVQRWTQLNKQTSSRNRVNTAGTVRSWFETRQAFEEEESFIFRPAADYKSQFSCIISDNALSATPIIQLPETLL